MYVLTVLLERSTASTPDTRSQVVRDAKKASITPMKALFPRPIADSAQKARIIAPRPLRVRMNAKSAPAARFNKITAKYNCSDSLCSVVQSLMTIYRTKISAQHEFLNPTYRV
jgi:hypothetical protein